jgi:anti-sigma regulatory factor (Ser/Thr protein kinase)
MPPVEATASPRPEDGSGPDVSFALCLPHAAAATGDARHVIRRRLGDLLSEDALDDVLLVVSELVANAVLHGRGEIALELAFDGRRVTGMVGDEGGGFGWTPRLPGPRGSHGYGLELVAMLSAGWSLEQHRSRVHFEIALQAPR